jgi:hypothetical protein
MSSVPPDGVSRRYPQRMSDGAGSLPKGVCSVCSATGVLTKSGSLRSHPPYPAKTCPGSYRTPEGKRPVEAEQARQIARLEAEVRRLSAYQAAVERLLISKRESDSEVRMLRGFALAVYGQWISDALSGDVPGCLPC